MIKNASVMVTDRCNSRCTTCHIWSSPPSPEISSDGFRDLFTKPEFQELEDISITGGEATLRPDLIEVIEAIIQNKSKLHMLFLCTNGSNIAAVRNFVESFHARIKDVFVAVSFEGLEPIHNKIRGVNTYNTVLRLLETCKSVSARIHTILSATITPLSCTVENLRHIQEVARQTGSTFSFKPMIVNNHYYKNRDMPGQGPLSIEQRNLLMHFIENHCMDDPFMRIQLHYLQTGEIPLMGDGSQCLAGDTFIFVRPTGDIYPCCNSSRKIGDAKNGLFNGVQKIIDLGKQETCPCCNEMCVYPMLNWSSYATLPTKQD